MGALSYRHHYVFNCGKPARSRKYHLVRIFRLDSLARLQGTEPNDSSAEFSSVDCLRRFLHRRTCVFFGAESEILPRGRKCPHADCKRVFIFFAVLYRVKDKMTGKAASRKPFALQHRAQFPVLYHIHTIIFLRSRRSSPYSPELRTY